MGFGIPSVKPGTTGDVLAYVAHPAKRSIPNQGAITLPSDLT